MVTHLTLACEEEFKKYLESITVNSNDTVNGMIGRQDGTFLPALQDGQVFTRKIDVVISG